MSRSPMLKDVSIAVAALSVGFGVTAAQALPLVVVNPSFETPPGAVLSAAAPGIHTVPVDFIVPFLGVPQSAFGWQTAGTPVDLDPGPDQTIVVPVVMFNNTAFNAFPSFFITNADGDNVVSIQATTNTFLQQMLSDSYQVGTSYSFTAALGMSVNSPVPAGSKLSMDFFYLDGQANLVVLQTIAVDESVLSGTSLIDRSLLLPAVQAGDAWAGKQIGIRFGGVSAAPTANGGFLNFDNVRVDASAVAAAIPEPATFGALALAASLGLMRRRRLAY